jgi:hypothetical protein
MTIRSGRSSLNMKKHRPQQVTIVPTVLRFRSIVFPSGHGTMGAYFHSQACLNNQAPRETRKVIS